MTKKRFDISWSSIVLGLFLFFIWEKTIGEAIIIKQFGLLTAELSKIPNALATTAYLPIYLLLYFLVAAIFIEMGELERVSKTNEF